MNSIRQRKEEPGALWQFSGTARHHVCRVKCALQPYNATQSPALLLPHVRIAANRRRYGTGKKHEEESNTEVEGSERSAISTGKRRGCEGGRDPSTPKCAAHNRARPAHRLYAKGEQHSWHKVAA